mgnify:CR=1 FL=1
MGEVVNLRLARKRVARQQREALAQANRASHGRTKAKREATEAQQATANRRLDLHRLDNGAPKDRPKEADPAGRSNETDPADRPT